MKIRMSLMIKWWHKLKMINAPQPSPQVVNRRNSPLLQAYPQGLIIGSPSNGVMTRSQKLTSFIEHHSFVSCVEPKNVEEALQDSDWINAMHEELNNFTRNEVWTLEERPQGVRVIGTKWCSATSKMIKAL